MALSLMSRLETWLLVLILFNVASLLLWNWKCRRSTDFQTTLPFNRANKGEATISQSKTKDAKCHQRKDQRYSFIATRSRVAEASYSAADQSPTVCVSELGITEKMNELAFASLLLMTLDHISFCILAGGKPLVYWRGGLSFIRRKSKNPLFNSWSLFFEPLSINTEKKTEKTICLGRMLEFSDYQIIVPKENIYHRSNLKSSFKPKPVLNLRFRKPVIPNLPFINFEGVISTDTKFWVNSLLKKFIKVKEPIKEKVERFYHKYLHGHYMLGVHTRGTDHFLETELRRLPKLELWVREAEMIFSSMPSPKRIFVASDNMEAVEKFVEHFGRDDVSIEKKNVHSDLGFAVAFFSEPPSPLLKLFFIISGFYSDFF